MKKRMIAFMMAVAMLLGCVCDVSVVSAAEENSEKYYLRRIWNYGAGSEPEYCVPR